MGIQRDFGGFDPAFIGITLRFATPRTWRAFQAFHQSAQPPPVRDHSEEAAFETLCMTSVMSHELRHFHDFLLSPYSAGLFKKRVILLLNTMQALVAIAVEDGNCLPVPLPLWCTFDETQRARELKYLPERPDGQAWKPLYLPHIEADDFDTSQWRTQRLAGRAGLEHSLRYALVARQEIERLTRGPIWNACGSSLEPWELFELPGLLAQAQDIWQTYGSWESALFYRYLQDDMTSPYGRILRFATTVCSRLGHPNDVRLVSLLNTWCLLGSYHRDGDDASPGLRFGHLFDYLSRVGLRFDEGDPMTTFDLWSRELRLSTVGEGVEEAAQIHRRVLDLLDEWMTSHPSAFFLHGEGPTLRRIAAGLVSASETMSASFLNDPMGYISLRRYLSQATALPAPCVRLMFDSGGLDLSKKSQRDELYVQWISERDGERLAVSVIEPPSGSRSGVVGPEDACRFASHFGLMDFLLSETNRGQFEVRTLGRALLENSGVHPLEVMGRVASH